MTVLIPHLCFTNNDLNTWNKSITLHLAIDYYQNISHLRNSFNWCHDAMHSDPRNYQSTNSCEKHKSHFENTMNKFPGKLKYPTQVKSKTLNKFLSLCNGDCYIIMFSMEFMIWTFFSHLLTMKWWTQHLEEEHYCMKYNYTSITNTRIHLVHKHDPISNSWDYT